MGESQDICCAKELEGFQGTQAMAEDLEGVLIGLLIAFAVCDVENEAD
jgi:hypothetical protein